MLFGVGTVLYALTVLAQAIIQSEIIEALGIRQKRQEMDKIKDHYIVCGAGRVGRRIITICRNKISRSSLSNASKTTAEFEEDGAAII